jgi:hypothetical protein
MSHTVGRELRLQFVVIKVQGESAHYIPYVPN